MLEKHNVATSDLLSLGAADTAKRICSPAATRDLARLIDCVLDALHLQLDAGAGRGPDGAGDHDGDDDGDAANTGLRLLGDWRTVTTLDRRLDDALGGGLPTGYVTEITGERWVPALLASTTSTAKLTPRPVAAAPARPSSC